jgi:membrane fusion protein (multidrug efflux system)
MSRWLPLLLVACSGLGAGDPPAPAGPPPALVRVAEAEGGVLADGWELPAEVRALDQARLAAGASGPVVRLAVREGARVERGELLLQVDPAPAAARLAVAQAEARETEVALERARREVERTAAVADGVLSASELDDAATAVRTLEARLARQQAAAREARVVLQRHDLVAPFAGSVAALQVSEGDWVEPSAPVLTLVSSDRLDLRVDAPRELVDQVAIGDAVAVRRDAGAVQARVVGLVPSLEPVARTAVIRLEPEEAAPWLVAGLAATARFEVRREAADGAIVPRDALVLGVTGARVFRVVEGKAELVEVEVVATAEDRALVRPLAAGDRVVVRGNERLRGGQPVTVEGSP